MWSDPEDIETWAVSPRGAGWLFGAKVTNEVRIPIFEIILKENYFINRFLFSMQIL